MHLHHLFVVGRSQASLASHINHHNDFLSPEFLEGHNVTRDILHLEVEEALGDIFAEGFRTRLEHSLVDQATH